VKNKNGVSGHHVIFSIYIIRSFPRPSAAPNTSSMTSVYGFPPEFHNNRTLLEPWKMSTLYYRWAPGRYPRANDSGWRM